jgi:hypothetical protein
MKKFLEKCFGRLSYVVTLTNVPEFLYASDVSKEEDFISYYDARMNCILKAIELIKDKKV